MIRTEAIHKLQSETFDLCVIGSGASGAGCALDAALRGLKVALVEKNDFASGTSSKSTKLIHGGVRYLEQAFKNLDFAQLRQVRHGLQERHAMLTNAPHLAHPLALVTPVFSWWEGLYFRIGLWLYDRFASRKDKIPASRWLSKAEALRRLPGLTDQIHSAVLYYDGQLDDARYCLALVQSAAEAGAVVSNYLEITGFEKSANGRITAAQVRDSLTSETLHIRARCFLNCTGPQADAVRRLANPGIPSRIRPSKGVHLLLPQALLDSPDTALLIPNTPDGRVVFAIPFQGELLLGTTDQDYPEPDREPYLEAREIDFLLKTLEPYLRTPAHRDQVKAGFGGLRPLIAAGSKGKTTKGLVRDHEVELDERSGLFSLLGGKWTTYRLMACDAVDAVCRRLGVRATCTTAGHILAGGEHFSPLIETILRDQFQFPGPIARHLTGNYGSRAIKVAELTRENPGWRERLVQGYPFIRAEVVHAVRAEMACTLRDVLARRIRLEILDWEATVAAIPAVASIMAEELQWTEQRRAQEMLEYRRMIESFGQMAGITMPE